MILVEITVKGRAMNSEMCSTNLYRLQRNMKPDDESIK
jgi:hypothetical protein